MHFVGSSLPLIAPREHGFDVHIEPDRVEPCRKVLLATGVRDELPQIPGFEALYGKRIHHCPYCDGWELRGTRLGVLGEGEKVHHLALKLSLDGGTTISLRALFFTNRVQQSSRLAEQLGCALDASGGISTDKLERTSVPGVFAAGNMIKEVEI